MCDNPLLLWWSCTQWSWWYTLIDHHCHHHHHTGSTGIFFGIFLVHIVIAADGTEQERGGWLGGWEVFLHCALCCTHITNSPFTYSTGGGTVVTQDFHIAPKNTICYKQTHTGCDTAAAPHTLKIWKYKTTAYTLVVGIIFYIICIFCCEMAIYGNNICLSVKTAHRSVWWTDFRPEISKEI